MSRIVMGVSGASGASLARMVLAQMSEVQNLEVHLVVSSGAQKVLELEEGETLDSLLGYADQVYDEKDLGAGPSSGSWLHDGMIICPCSMSSLASIACGAGMNLIHRAADVTLKERRPLVIVARETPLNLIHIRNMQTVTEAGATVMPFCPSFYLENPSMPAMVRHFTGRMLDICKIPHRLCSRWKSADSPTGKS